jgi:hypothetical protein
MISVLCVTLAAAPLGPCADRAACSFSVESKDKALLSSLKSAVAALELKESAPPAEPLKKEGGDVSFALSARVSDDGVTLFAHSRHRPVALFGKVKVEPARTPEKFRLQALEVALRGAIEKAMADLGGQLDESFGHGKRTLRFSVRVNGLEAKVKTHVAEQFLPCLKQQFELTGPVTAATESGGYLEEKIEYVPSKDEPRESLKWQVSRLKDATLSGPKAACTVLGTPIGPPFAVRFAEDALNRGVVVTFHR